jgi:peptidoglycan/LPS O-acetylase OafA/YrhL
MDNSGVFWLPLAREVHAVADQATLPASGERSHVKTIGARLAHYRGLGPGFDFLRIGLACMIVMIHADFQTGSSFLRDSYGWFLEYALVPMFFALSGFLISASALRLSLGNFLINRGLRIVPALAVDVVVCALIIGPLMTTVDLSAYFTDPDFYQYFLNITGWIHYRLPGVFDKLPTYRVNGALWTVPYEILCYAIISGFIVFGALKRPLSVALSIAAFMAIGLIGEVYQAALPAPFYAVIRFFFVSRGGQTITAFLLGIFAYQLRDRLPYSWLLFLTSCAICVGAAIMLRGADIEHVGNRFIVLPALVYMTVFLGLTPIPVPRIVSSGDYSYGVYLYHSPILQILIALAPALFIRPLGPLLLVVCGIPAVGLFAAFSWHYIEKPILGLRKRFSFVAKVRGVTEQEFVPVSPAAPAPPRLPAREQIGTGVKPEAGTAGS